MLPNMIIIDLNSTPVSVVVTITKVNRLMGLF